MSRARSFMLILICALVVLPNDSRGAQNKSEKWYTYWGLGDAEPTYPSEVGSLLDLMGALPGVDRTRMSMDLLGFYMPISGKMLAGVVVNATADRLDYGDHRDLHRHYRRQRQMCIRDRSNTF